MADRDYMYMPLDYLLTARPRKPAKRRELLTALRVRAGWFEDPKRGHAPGDPTAVECRERAAQVQRWLDR